MRSVYEKAANQEIFNKTPYINGSFKGKVKFTGFSTVEQTHTTDVFSIIEFEIVESNRPDIKPGATYGQSIKLSTNAGMADAKKFCAVLGGVDVTDAKRPTITREIEEAWGSIAGRSLSMVSVMELVFSPDNPLIGEETILETFDRPQKKDPSKMFTHHNWSSPF